MRALPASLAALGLALGCSSTAPTPQRATPPPPRELPPDWAERSPYAFERWVEAELPDGTATVLAPGALDELGAALARGGPAGLRAAVLLGRSATPAATEGLLIALERRTIHEERAADAADVVAAGALRATPLTDEVLERLERLAVGPDPHPDLEVRVECASSVLVAGRDTPIPFLLRVLRIDTLSEDRAARDFEASRTTAWARGRAALALARRAGAPVRYRTDAPLERRAAAAAELAQALGYDVPFR